MLLINCRHCSSIWQTFWNYLGMLMLIVINSVILALLKNARQLVLCFYVQNIAVVAVQVSLHCPPKTAQHWSGGISSETYLIFHAFPHPWTLSRLSWVLNHEKARRYSCASTGVWAEVTPQPPVGEMVHFINKHRFEHRMVKVFMFHSHILSLWSSSFPLWDKLYLYNLVSRHLNQTS